MSRDLIPTGLSTVCGSTEPENPQPSSSGSAASTNPADGTSTPKEIGGRDGPEPTRFGDWEKAGRCIDF